MRVLVIGAGGVFGSRLARGLVRDGFAVVVAGRDRTRAETTAQALRVEGGPSVTTAVLDTRTLTPETLLATGAGIVIDAAGPFQGETARVARAAIAAGLHYVDLADARDFVAGFAALDEAAKAAGVVALTGASSTPALSNAVLDHLTLGWRRVDGVEAAISPGARAPRGRSVTEAILWWLGRPVRVFEQGRWGARPGWGDLKRRDFGAAGRRWVSLCETPDLDVLPQRFQPTDRAVFMAGLEPGLAHGAAWLLARVAARTGWSMVPLAGLLMQASKLAGLVGDDRGAMRVEAVGIDGGGRGTRAVWRLIAPPGVGPVTPGLPALAAVKVISAARLEAGARVCVGALSVKALEAELAAHGIETGTTVERSALFSRAIGAGFDALPEALKALHETQGSSLWRGRCRVEGAQGLAAGLVGRLFGFPGAGEDLPVQVAIEADEMRSVWRRAIAGRRFVSRLSLPNAGAHGYGRVVERFGPLAFDLVLRPDEGRLIYEVRGWRAFGLPMPRGLAPSTRTHEAVDALGRFEFDVEIGLPLLGRMVRYRGWLKREADTETAASGD